MSIRVCVLVCATTLLASAEPVPQHTVDIHEDSKPSDTYNIGSVEDFIPEVKGNKSYLQPRKHDIGKRETQENDKEIKSDDSNVSVENENKPSGSNESNADSELRKRSIPLVLSTAKMGRATLKMVKLTVSAIVLCQDLKYDNIFIDLRCVINQPLSTFKHIEKDAATEWVGVYPQHIDQKDYVCQVIISFFRGPLQALCVSDKDFFYDART